ARSSLAPRSRSTRPEAVMLVLAPLARASGLWLRGPPLSLARSSLAPRSTSTRPEAVTLGAGSAELAVHGEGAAQEGPVAGVHDVDLLVGVEQEQDGAAAERL